MNRSPARIRPLSGDAWDRQPTESVESWIKFVDYRDSGPQRTYKQIAAKHNCGVRSIQHLASKWRWADRIEAWDLHLDSLRQEVSENNAKDTALRHAALGKQAIDLAQEALGSVDPKDMSVGEATRLMDCLLYTSPSPRD